MEFYSEQQKLEYWTQVYQEHGMDFETALKAAEEHVETEY